MQLLNIPDLAQQLEAHYWIAWENRQQLKEAYDATLEGQTPPEHQNELGPYDETIIDTYEDNLSSLYALKYCLARLGVPYEWLENPNHADGTPKTGPYNGPLQAYSCL